MSYGNNNFWSATNLCLRYASAKCGRLFDISGYCFFCNLSTPKTVISNFVTTRQIETPYISPYGYPNNVPGGQKNSRTKKTLGHKCINSLVSHKLSHDRQFWFNRPSTPQFGQPSRVAPAGRAPRAQWKKKRTQAVISLSIGEKHRHKTVFGLCVSHCEAQSSPKFWMGLSFRQKKRKM